jgi:NADPH-dependent 2,4-dienoyl-CoA reductase/sulfur reductase-like enzyme
VPKAAVVGAGQSGLIAARLLAERDVETTLVERLPAPGGQEPEGPTEARLADSAARSGVHFKMGTFAVRWDGARLTMLGIDGADAPPVDALVVASGTRPASRGELDIAGDRCAGILPATAAIHLIEAGVLPGHRPVVYGGGGLAARCAHLLLEAGADEVTVVSADPFTASLPVQAKLLTGWRIASAHGGPRLSSLTLEQGGASEPVSADALLLAVGRIPMRNIEGAVAAEAASAAVVPCHSSADPKRVDDAALVARAAVERTISLTNDGSRSRRPDERDQTSASRSA